MHKLNSKRKISLLGYFLLGLCLLGPPSASASSERTKSAKRQLEKIQQKMELLKRQATLLKKEETLLRWELSLLKREAKHLHNDFEKAQGCKKGKTPALQKVGKINAEGPAWGPKNAKVTIVAFSDFQCPFCSRGAKTIKQIKKAYGEKVRVVFKHLPLGFHRNAHSAAQASMAAHAQGKFWAFHDKLFDNFRNLNKTNYLKWAKELGLDVASFKAALDNGKYKKYVDNDAEIARSIGANGTPTFFINGYRLVGAQPFFRFKKVIDNLLVKK